MSGWLLEISEVCLIFLISLSWHHRIGLDRNFFLEEDMAAHCAVVAAGARVPREIIEFILACSKKQRINLEEQQHSDGW